VTVQWVAFILKWMEWPAERGSKSAPIDAHDYSPLDMEWIDVGGKRACIRSSNNNRIEKTVFAHGLVDGFKTTFAFKSTAYDVGDRLGRDADKVRVEVDGETVRVVAAFYQLTSELDRKGAHTWYGPRFKRLGVLGQPTGPTIEQVRVARDLRFEFKLDEEKRKALSAVRPTPALSAPDQLRRGSTTFTSGLGPSVASRSWAAPAQPTQTIDPKFDDDIPS
jgi:hypothetical protein